MSRYKKTPERQPVASNLIAKSAIAKSVGTNTSARVGSGRPVRGREG